jgi:choline/glycine/proline betaine transport protein
VSKGRTIREFIMGVLFLPTLATFAWITIFGGTAVHEEIQDIAMLKETVAQAEVQEDGLVDTMAAKEVTQQGGISKAVDESVETALFILLERFPFAALISVAATLVIISFFVTSSDSGSLVIDIITSGGHPDPPIPQRLFWAILEGVVAAVLLSTGYAMDDPAGGLKALQTGAITTGLPFCAVLLLICWSLVRGLKQERALHRKQVFIPPEEDLEKAVHGSEADEYGSQDVRRRPSRGFMNR